MPHFLVSALSYRLEKKAGIPCRLILSTHMWTHEFTVQTETWQDLHVEFIGAVVNHGFSLSMRRLCLHRCLWHGFLRGRGRTETPRIGSWMDIAFLQGPVWAPLCVWYVTNRHLERTCCTAPVSTTLTPANLDLCFLSKELTSIQMSLSQAALPSSIKAVRTLSPRVWRWESSWNEF